MRPSRLAGTGATAGLCPMTEANLGDGTFPGVDWLAAGGRYGVGTDSNVTCDAAQELRQLEYSQRLGQRGRNLMAGDAAGASTGRALFEVALAAGAVLRPGVAGLQVGASADLVTLRPDDPSLVHCHGDRLLDGWIFAGDRRAIDNVWVRGRALVSRRAAYRSGPDRHPIRPGDRAAAGVGQASNTMSCTPSHSTLRPSVARSSRPSVIVRTWLPANCPALLAKQQGP